MYGEVESVYVQNRIVINVPRRILRTASFLHVSRSLFNYLENQPIKRMFKDFNHVFCVIDFNYSTNANKLNIVKYLRLSTKVLTHNINTNLLFGS